jgi:hypothetical protein
MGPLTDHAAHRQPASGRGDPPMSFVGRAEAINRFGERPDRPSRHGTDHQWASRKMNWGSQLFMLQLLLFHTGQLPELPKEPIATTAVWPTLPEQMQDVLDRYLTARRQLDRPATGWNIEARMEHRGRPSSVQGRAKLGRYRWAVGRQQATEHTVVRLGVEDRDSLAVGGQAVGVGVFATLDEPVGS